MKPSTKAGAIQVHKGLTGVSSAAEFRDDTMVMDDLPTVRGATDMGEIAFLGWGSLCWDIRDLPVDGEWLSAGPTLPLEFARISRDGRLTLVIDEAGTPCQTRFIWSSISTLRGSIEALRQREGTATRWIGYRARMGGGSSIDEYSEQVNVDDVIARWTNDHPLGATAAVWTALRSNFHEKRGVALDAAKAVDYLRSLNPQSLDRALQYFARAPSEVQTPVRLAVATEWSL
jgi:hypothetical protein